MSKTWVKQWAKGLLGMAGAVIVDTETTGLGPADEVVAVAAVDTAGNVLLDTLVRPVCATVEAGAYAIHGIGTKTLVAAPTFVELADEFIAAVEGRNIIGYNISFDARLLRQGFLACGEAGEALLRWHQTRIWHDVMEPYAKHWAAANNRYNARWQKLAVACQQQGIATGNLPNKTHSALGDAQLTLALLQRLAGVS